jgi:hypothetical protein
VIAHGFETKWDFPNCVGALDGKHIVMRAPANQGSNWYNYKGAHSIVLMAICDAYYRFVYVSIGDTGRRGDAGVFANCGLGERLDSNYFHFPPDSKIPKSQKYFPYILLGDDAFPLKRNIVKPYPGQNNPMDKVICNYRVSRGRRCIENAFGILCSRWRVFYSPINMHYVGSVKLITKACVALHNFLMTENNDSTDENNYTYCPKAYVDRDGPTNGTTIEGGWRKEWREENRSKTCGMRDLDKQRGGSSPVEGKILRDQWKDYFNNEGQVEWQMAHCTYSGPKVPPSQPHSQPHDQ